jgi:hypothetical protein
VTTTQKRKRAARPGTLLVAVIEATDGTHLRAALAAYEATGDHDHGRGPIGPGRPCPGGDCWVTRARRALAALEALNGVE